MGKGGQYRYYKCNARISKGNTACPSKNFPQGIIDNLVLNTFTHKIYTTNHTRDVIDTLRQNLAKNKDGGTQQCIKQLESELKQIEIAQAKLYEAIEKGIIELDDQLRERTRQKKQTREALLAEIASLKLQQQAPLNILTPQKIESVSRILKNRLTASSEYSRAYLRATLNEIRITDQFLKLSGQRKSLADLVTANGQISPDKSGPGSIPDWRALVDLNH